MKPVWMVLLFIPFTASLAAQEFPMTRSESVSDTYHGIEVADPYRWLESGESPEVQAWTKQQNTFARNYLDKLAYADEIREEVREILGHESPSYSGISQRNGRTYVLLRQPPKQQPMIVELLDVDDPSKARTVVDPNEMDADGTTAIDWFEVSPNGKLIAVSLSQLGTEVGDVIVFDVDQGKPVDVTIPRVNSGTAGGDLAWANDSQGFYYTRHPRPGERPLEDLGFFQQLYFHRLGTSTDQDQFELGTDFPRIAEIEVEVGPSGRVMANVQNGDSGQFSHYLRDLAGNWQQISTFEDRHIQATFGPEETLLVISFEDAPLGKILQCNATSPDLAQASTLVPESDAAVVTSFYHSPPSILATDRFIVVTYQLGGPSELRVFNRDGKQVTSPKQPAVGSVGGLARLAEGKIAFQAESYVTPSSYWIFDPATGSTNSTDLGDESAIALDGIEVSREFATSKDGTQVPVNILASKDLKRDGSNPTILYGYGGFGISIEPRFNPSLHVLLRRGFVYAIANLRGGGEYGESWHHNVRLTKKQNVFDDFAAAIRHLFDRSYTAPEYLGTMGGSNGGLLMGAALTQHPDQIKAVVALVGIYDMLRVELSANGAFNIPEFGTVEDKDQFEALYGYSPYHRVVDETDYPAVLLITGANDPRVDPMQSRKMTARLQKATSSNAPVLLRTNAKAGHGGDSSLSDRVEQTVDIYAFFLTMLSEHH